MGEKRALVYWHFFKPIIIVLGGAKRRVKPWCQAPSEATVLLQNSLGRELVLVERVYVQNMF